MRIPTYLSPSSLGLWESDSEEFYMKHLAEIRPQKIPQADYMAVGSAFDAYVKAELYSALFGATNPQFEFDTIFISQVEEHNRDFCIEAGKYIMDCYKLTGAYDDLLAELQKSKTDPEFEFRVDGQIAGIPLMGKPDCRYIHESGAHIILDWKINGFCSKYGATPYKFYSLIRDGWDDEKHSRSHGTFHKGYKPMMHKGVKIGSHYLEESSKDWADQLAIYSWMLHEEVGDENVIVCIDQVTSKPRELQFPLLRIANHRCRISKKWQESLIERLVNCWTAIQSGYVFKNMGEDDSASRCEVLEMQAASLAQDSDDSVESWVGQISREQKRFRAR